MKTLTRSPRSPRPPAPELAFTARPRSVPLHRWAYESLRAAILDGRLPPGTRVPSTRDLSQQLGVARGTVVAVFEQLSAEGYLTSRGGSGTFVADDLPDAWFEVTAPKARPRVGAPPARLSAFGRSLHGSPFPLELSPAPRPFRAHVPAFDAFPHETWGRIVAKHARRETRAGLQGGDAAGTRSLREALAAHVRVARGVECSADRIVITSGAQQSLDLIARLVLDRGDQVWIEDPGYVGARVVLEASGANLVPVPVDDDGMRVELGVARAPNAKLAYVTPAHHAPLGVTLPADRRLALLDWATTQRAWVVEDDYDSEFRYESRPVAALAALDRHGVVIHTGSFSKTMVPGLRLAYVVAPESFAPRLVAAKSVLDRFTPPLLQEALAEFIREGHFARHLRRMRELYSERRTALLEALADELPWLDVVGADAGIDVVVRLPEGIDDGAATLALEKAGIDAMPLSSNAIRPLTRGGLILGFATFTPPKLRAAVAAMKRALAPLLATARRPSTRGTRQRTT